MLLPVLLAGVSVSVPHPAPTQEGPLENPAVAAESALERRPVAIVYGDDAALCASLPRLCETWADAGGFALGAASAAEIAALRARGAEVVGFDAPRAEDELYLVHADGALELPTGARVLLTQGERALIAWPNAAREQGGADALAALSKGAHCGPLRIERRALPPVPEFRWRGLRGAEGVQLVAGADPRISALVAQLDKANMQAKDVALASNFTRRADQPGATTAQNQIAGWLTGFGFAPTLHTFSASYSKNVVAEIPGSVDPSKVVVLGAHYDSINLGGSALAAPGADDNASGSAALLEVARVLKSGGPYEHTLRFIWFSAEEFGLVGSAAAAALSKSSGEQVLGMLNMDMVAYRKAGDVRDCDFATNSTSATLTAFADATSALYVAGWASQYGVLTAGSSDHAAYNAEGFPSAFFFEDLVDFYAQIHTASDTNALSTTDWDLAQMIGRGVLATAATMAEPVDLQIAHTPLPDTNDGVGPYLASASITSQTAATVAGATLWHSSDDGQSWSGVAMSGAGASWSALVPSAGSPKTIRYWIEAQDSAGNTEVAPSGADLGAAYHSFFVGSKTQLYANGFEAGTDDGWTHGALSGTDDWQRGTPVGKAGDPSSAFAGTKVWANDLGANNFNGEYPANAHNWLRSPVVNCASASNVHLSLRRWLNVEDALFDQAEIWVNNAKVWTNPSSAGGSNHTNDSAWQSIHLDVSAQAAGVASTRVEFRLKSDGGLQMGGWTLDELRLERWDAAPPPGPPVFALAPSSAAAIGGQSIVASGTGMGGVTSVTVGGAPVAFAQGAGQVSFALPQQLALGNVLVQVATAAGTNAQPLSIVQTVPPALVAPATHATGQVLSLPVGAQPNGFAWLLFSSHSGATSIPGLVSLEIGNGNLLDLYALSQHALSAAGTWTFALPVPSGTGLAGQTAWLEALLFDPSTSTLDSTNAASVQLQ
ncbi:MAG: M28 family peptidase [Planctomycetota bacterium]|nr:MAG: M28 family peptidase [Planctomycetota bacterium]